MNPPSILSRDFRYTPAAKTDIRKTFARIRREQKERDEKQAEQFNNILRMRK